MSRGRKSGLAGVVAPVEPPANFTDEQAAQFRHTVASMGDGYFRPCHASMLERHTVLYVANRKLYELVDDGDDDACKTFRANSRELSSLERGLRMTPQSQLKQDHATYDSKKAKIGAAPWEDEDADAA